jgi:hypothetical protein
MDGQANASGKTSFERLLLGGLEALWIMNTMNSAYEHVSSKPGTCTRSSHPTHEMASFIGMSARSAAT